MTNIPPAAGVIASASIPQMPPLGPAPAQLPPVIHPPPIPVPQSVISGTSTAAFDAQAVSAVPIQATFETLSLNSPLEPIAPITELASDTDAAQPPADGQAIFPPTVDDNALVATANGDVPLGAEGEKSGKTDRDDFLKGFIDGCDCRSAQSSPGEHVDTERYERIQRTDPKRKKMPWSRLAVAKLLR